MRRRSKRKLTQKEKLDAEKWANRMAPFVGILIVLAFVTVIAFAFFCDESQPPLVPLP